MKEFEFGTWNTFQVSRDGLTEKVRLFRNTKALQMNWLYLNEFFFDFVSENKIQFRKGIFTYILSFKEVGPDRYKTSFSLKLL